MEIREYSDVTAKGRNLYAFINAVRQSDIRCGEQHCKGGTFRCRILRADERALQTLADSQNITLRFNRRRSLLGIFQRYRLRFGILIGVILGGCIIFYQSNVVQSIEITGNQKVYESVIRSVLEQEGIRQGVWIPDIDMTHCERAVRAVIPDIAWCGIRHTGNHGDNPKHTYAQRTHPLQYRCCGGCENHRCPCLQRTLAAAHRRWCRKGGYDRQRCISGSVRHNDLSPRHCFCHRHLH